MYLYVGFGKLTEIINFGIYFLVKNNYRKIVEIIFRPRKITGIGENYEKISSGRYEYDGSKESVWGSRYDY
jgi:hypothetical protein